MTVMSTGGWINRISYYMEEKLESMSKVQEKETQLETPGNTKKTI